MSPVRSLSSSFAVLAIDPSERHRQNSLIERFTDLGGRQRVAAMDLLRTLCEDEANNRRICYNIVQVSSRV